MLGIAAGCSGFTRDADDSSLLVAAPFVEWDSPLASRRSCARAAGCARSQDRLDVTSSVLARIVCWGSDSLWLLGSDVVLLGADGTTWGRGR